MREVRALLLLISLGFCAVTGSGSSDTGASGTIEIHAHRFAFVPSEITVKEGETVKVRLVSDDVPHSLLIKELGINQAVSKSHPSEFTFVPNKAGDFHGKCGRFCGSGHAMMTFTVHVTGN
jgi:cytochrome c oxidase subunit 2